jgi:hypothetical protein
MNIPMTSYVFGALKNASDAALPVAGDPLRA